MPRSNAEMCGVSTGTSSRGMHAFRPNAVALVLECAFSVRHGLVPKECFHAPSEDKQLFYVIHLDVFLPVPF